MSKPASQDATSPSHTESLLLSRVKAAVLLDLSVATLDRMQAAGKLPRTLVVNGGVRYRREDLVRWIALGCPDRKTFDAADDV